MSKTKLSEIPKAYDSSNLPDDKAGTEDKWYKYWLDNTPCSIVQKLTKTLNQLSVISSELMIY